MIARLVGKVVERQQNSITLDVNGVGYEVFVSGSTQSRLQTSLATALGMIQSDTTLLIHTNVREDAIQLFGFIEQSELDVFRLLISVNGIGPRSAMSIMNVDVCVLANAIGKRSTSALTKIPGIGKKMAEKIIMDLADKMKPFMKDDDVSNVNVDGSGVMRDAVNALVALGYRRLMSQKAVDDSSKVVGTSNVDELVKESLRNIGS